MIRTIELTNCQSHRHLLLELPPKGIIRFTGENNHGKSVYTKFMTDFLRDNYRNSPLKRKGMVRYTKLPNGSRLYTQYAECKITLYNGKAMCIHLEIEAKSCWVTYWNERGEETTRYFSEGSYLHIAREFGYHINEKYDISLNFYRTYDALIGATTPYALNAAVVDEAVTDPYTELGIANMDEAIKEQDKLIALASSIENDSAAELSALAIYDEERERGYMDSFQRYATLVFALGERPFELETIVPYQYMAPIKLDLIKALTPLAAMPVPIVLDPPPKVNSELIDALKSLYLEDLTERIVQLKETKMNLKQLKSAKCPTCGRGFSESEVK